MNCLNCNLPIERNDFASSLCFCCTAASLASARKTIGSLEMVRDSMHLSTASALAARAEMRGVLQEIVDYGCVSHGVGCPEDDTCGCRIPLRINTALSADAGKGWVSPKESADVVKKQMDAARLVALREAVATIRARITNPNALTERDCGLADAVFAIEPPADAVANTGGWLSPQEAAALKLQAADRNEWQQVAMKVRAELDEIRRVIGDRYPNARMLDTVHALRAALRTYGVHTSRCLEGRTAEAKAVLAGTGTISKCTCGLDELRGTGGEVTLETVAERYRTAKAELLMRSKAKFSTGSKVAVECPQYTGPGVVTMEDGCPPDKLSVRLENGNVWRYPVEACKLAALPDDAPALTADTNKTITTSAGAVLPDPKS